MGNFPTKAIRNKVREVTRSSIAAKAKLQAEKGKIFEIDSHSGGVVPEAYWKGLK